jgi:hypothetical protein
MAPNGLTDRGGYIYPRRYHLSEISSAPAWANGHVEPIHPIELQKVALLEIRMLGVGVKAGQQRNGLRPRGSYVKLSGCSWLKAFLVYAKTLADFQCPNFTIQCIPLMSLEIYPVPGRVRTELGHLRFAFLCNSTSLM